MAHIFVHVVGSCTGAAIHLMFNHVRSLLSAGFHSFSGQNGPRHHLRLQMAWLLLWLIAFPMLYVHCGLSPS
jgi:hypothetical protein